MRSVYTAATALLWLCLIHSVHSIVVPSEKDTKPLMIARGGDKGGDGNEDPQSSRRIHPSQVQEGLRFNGIEENGDPGISPSLTSNNNFINFCMTQNVPLTNGKQVEDGSCNPTPMGRIVAKSKMPTVKFVFPRNGDTLDPGTPFTAKLAVRQFQTGSFTNAAKTYYAAPQTVNDKGFVIGHSHIVIERVEDYRSTEPLDAVSFKFFKGLNAPADENGILSTEVTDGLEPGFYRISSINTSANHSPIAAAVAQRGSLDDVVYFRVREEGDVFEQEPNGDSSIIVDEPNTDDERMVKMRLGANPFKF